MLEFFPELKLGNALAVSQILLFTQEICRVVVVHTFIPSTWEAETGWSLTLGPILRPELSGEAISKSNKQEHILDLYCNFSSLSF